MKYLFFLLVPGYLFGQDCKKDIKTQFDKVTGKTKLSTPVGKQLALEKEYSLQDTAYYFTAYLHVQETPENSKGAYILFEDHSKLELADAIINIAVNEKGSGFISSCTVSVTKETILSFTQKKIASIRLANSTEAIKEKQGKKFMCWAGLIY